QQVISSGEPVFGSPLAVLSENINFWASVVVLARVNMREILHFLSPYMSLFLSVIVFADDLLCDFLAVLGPPFARCAARPFFGEFAGGQLIASAEYIYCRVQREHINRMSSTPFNLERTIAQY